MFGVRIGSRSRDESLFDRCADGVGGDHDRGGTQTRHQLPQMRAAQAAPFPQGLAWPRES